MKHRTKYNILALRYAKALFDIAFEDGRVREIFDELLKFQAALQTVKSLEKALPVIQKISKILSLSPVVQNTIMLMIKKGRISLFDAMVESYRKMVEGFERISHIETQVADPSLADIFKDRIENILSKLLGKKVVCEMSVDESLIGGAVVRIQDVAIDASIAGRLAKMKEELYGNQGR